MVFRNDKHWQPIAQIYGARTTGSRTLRAVGWLTRRNSHSPVAPGRVDLLQQLCADTGCLIEGKTGENSIFRPIHLAKANYDVYLVVRPL